MSNQFHSDEELLARLVREAGDPSVAPDPQYAETLRATILDRLGPAETVADVPEGIGKADVIPITMKRTRPMKRIAKLAVAATILVALGILVSWMMIGGGSTNIAFADVAKVLDSLRSATFDLHVTSEATENNVKSATTATGKGFFLAPSHERMEVSVDIPNSPAIKAAAEAARRMSLQLHPADNKAAKAAAEAAAKSTAEALKLVPKTEMYQIVITDTKAAKTVMLMPNMKIAITMDMKKMYGQMKKSSGSPPPDLFEMVQRIVRQRSSGAGEEVKPLGKKQINGREAAGFWVHNAMNGMGDMTLWTDPETARPIQVELVGEMGSKIQMLMDNFRYDVDLVPSLFSLELPAGYSSQTVELTMPTEEDLLRTLRTVAEYNKGLFPTELAMNKEVMEAAMAGHKPAMPTMDKATQDKLNAEREKIVAKYGGREKLRAKYGNQLPPEIMAEMMKATMPIFQEQTQKQMRGQKLPTGRELQGVTFCRSLKPENDSHYVGGGVKLGTPDRPILWYKPTGAQKYRVIYADLSVKEMTADDVKKLPEVKVK